MHGTYGMLLVQRGTRWQGSKMVAAKDMAPCDAHLRQVGHQLLLLCLLSSHPGSEFHGWHCRLLLTAGQHAAQRLGLSEAEIYGIVVGRKGRVGRVKGGYRSTHQRDNAHMHTCTGCRTDSFARDQMDRACH